MQTNEQSAKLYAINHLIAEMKRENFEFNQGLEVEATQKVLFQLISPDASAQIVDLLATLLEELMNRVRLTQVQNIVQFLCTNSIFDNERWPGICSVGFTKLLKKLPSSMRSLPTECKSIIDILCQAVTRDNVRAIKTLLVFLKDFGSSLHPVHEDIAVVLLSKLSSTQPSTQKCAIRALVALMKCCTTRIANMIINTICENCSSQAIVDLHIIRSSIQCLSEI